MSAWMQAHEALSRLARERAHAEEGRWLLAALRSAVHVHLGFGGFGEYVERLFGYGRRFIREKLRVAEALERLPALALALSQGALNWSAVRELARVAVAETETEWLQVAQGKTARQLEALVAGKRPGDLPDSPPDEAARRHVLRFEVTGETFAVFQQALAELRWRSGSSFDDDAVLLEMARQVLGGLEGESDAGRATYQIAVSICPECGAGRQQAGADAIVIGEDALEMASCDAQHLGRVDGLERLGAQAASDGAPNDAAPNDGSPRDSAAIDAGPNDAEPNDAEPNDGAATDGAPNDAALTHVGHRARQTVPSGRRVPTRVGHCAKQTVPPSGRRVPTHVGHRAKQTVPPSVRRAVLRRDEGRCRVPGCRNALFFDVHHLELQSEGGDHDAGNLITLCGAHHRALHQGKLILELDGAGSLRFLHADGSVYGGVAHPQILDMASKLFSALRGLGFREGDVKRAIRVLRYRESLQSGSIQDWLRAALELLTPVRTARPSPRPGNE